MTLKRDNWTNEEVIKLIELSQIHDPGRESDKSYNAGIRDAAEHFRTHYLCPEKDMSALAYDTETGREVHIGEK